MQIIVAALTLAALCQAASAERVFNERTGQWIGSPDIPPSFFRWNERLKEQERRREDRSYCYARWRTEEAIERCLRTGR